MRIGLSTCAHAARAFRGVGMVCLCLLAAACATEPARLVAGADPADPAAPVPATAHRPALEGYVSQRPVDPAPWREQNERVAPKPKQ